MAFYPGRFDGRVAIITGGADGLGKGIAKRLVAEGGKVGPRPNYSRSGVSRRQE
jgi:NAD(P)-dependent dehydrogenase (short-subunit alcohol dehydrogenase family)